MSKELAITLFAVGWFGFWFVLHDVLIKGIYCDWKHKKNNGYRCYYWSCKHWSDCKYNGEKRKRAIPLIDFRPFSKGQKRDKNYSGNR